ncbi:MAG TPA: AAA family ATPase [Gemmatimonadales bacterium]|nr:AAA family ATPase [Gemmatimonadales bacterium]
MISGRTLGPVELQIDGAPAPAELLWRKNLALLVYLARSPRRARTRQHLMGLLWPDKPESSARHSLREAVRVLRRCAGEGAVETSGDQVRLSGTTELDVDRLDVLRQRTDWAQAASLVAGEFLEGFAVPEASAFEEWLAAERLAWRQRSVDVLVRHAESLLARGDATAAAGMAARAAGLDPLSEPAVMAVMKCLAVAGDRAGALEAYGQLTRRLADLGTVTPGAQVQSLAERVRDGRILRVPAHLAHAGNEGARVRRAPLVGHTSQFAALWQAWETARGQRRSALAVVLGDAGVGKTRVMEDLLARARLEDATVGGMYAVPADRATPWSGAYGLARSLQDAPGLPAARPAALAAFAVELPDWADRFGGRVQGVTPDPPGRALSEVIGALSEERPVILAVDDAQWLDDVSLEALGASLRDHDARALFLVLSAPPHSDRAALDGLCAHVGRDRRGAVIQLAPLPEAALRDLARWALPQYNDTELDRVTRRVAVDSAGLPLLAVELLHAIAVGLDLSDSEAAWPRPFKTLDESLPSDLPDAVVAAVRVGFRRLSPEAQRALTAIAVLGDRVEAATVSRATGLTGAALDGALDEIEWQRWVSADARGYGFVARIVKELVARDLVTPGNRQRIRDRAEEPGG